MELARHAFSKLRHGQLDQIAAFLLELAGRFGIDVVAVAGGFVGGFGGHDLLGFGGEAMNFVGAEDAAFAQDFLLFGGEGRRDLGLFPWVVLVLARGELDRKSVV